MQEVNPYATYRILPSLSYNIISELMTNDGANLIWKLLKYNSPDAWKQPNLTQDEKASLIYNGGLNPEKYNVFMDFMLDDSVTDERTILRIYPSYVYPENRTIGTCSINFEIFSHSKINHLSNYTTRVDDILQVLIETLNGININTVGVLFFDNERDASDKVTIIGNKPYKGKLLTMSVNIG